MSAEDLSDCVVSSAVIDRRYRAVGRTDIYYRNCAAASSLP